MSNTFVNLMGDGVTKVFNIPFPYLTKNHVAIYIDGLEETAFDVDNGILYLDEAPPSDSFIRIQRETPNDKRLVDYTDGSVLGEADLDTQSDQLMYLVQEAYDALYESIHTDFSLGGQHNAKNKKIKNVDDPVDPADATNKGYVDGQLDAHASLFNQILAQTEGLRDGIVDVHAQAVADVTAIKIATQGVHVQAVDDVTAIKALAETEADRATQQAAQADIEANRSYSEAERARIEADRAAAYKGPHIRPEEFGADPAGIQDSSAAFVAAIQAAHDQDLPLLCTGTYILYSQVALTGLTKSISIIGDGRGITKLLVQNSAGGIKLVFDHRDALVDISNLSFCANQGYAGVALDIAFTNTTSWAKRSVLIQNVDMVGADYTANAWNSMYFFKGIVLRDCWNAYISNVNIVGNTNKDWMEAAIEFNGACVASTIDKADLYYCNKAVAIYGDAEGFRLHDASVVGTNYGVYHDTATGEPEFKVTNSHFNCWKCSLYLNNIMRGVITGNFFKALDPAAFDLDPVTEFVDIWLLGTLPGGIQDIHIHNNQFNTPLPYYSEAIRVGHLANHVHIKDNGIRDRAVGVKTAPTSGGHVHVKGNLIRSVTQPVKFEFQTNCYFQAEQPDWCRAYRTSFAGIPPGGHSIPFNAREGTNLNLWSQAQGNTKIWVPGHAKIVRVSACIMFNMTDYLEELHERTAYIVRGGLRERGLPSQTINPRMNYNISEENTISLSSGLIPVIPGDYFELKVLHHVPEGPVYIRAAANTWMELEVVL